MRVGVEIPIYEAIIFNLDSAGANGFLKEYTACIFFIGKQLVNCFPIPSLLSCWREDTLFFKASGTLTKTFPSLILLEDPEDDSSFLMINDQCAIWRSLISVASAPRHFRTAVLKTFPKSSFNRLTLLKGIHFTSSLK